ncbi:LysR family transcriptional regulator [Actinocrispum sp. NPDC049592]|uniref:LysR family transcriptional regulator n=1 Tax=Actinocrispum sp. NPDC049592 TaxID=3154835 RepID=UPI0034161AD2
MTLTQLGTFVLVARLGSVKAAADALGVSEPAVSQALSALRQQFDDQLIVRAGSVMQLTPAGGRLLPLASKLVSLGADAQAAVRSGLGAPEELRVIASSTIIEFVVPPLLEAFTKGRITDTSAGVAASGELPVLVGNRFADVAIGPNLANDPGVELVSEPVFRTQLVVAGPPGGPPKQWNWLVGPSGTDPGSDCGRLLRKMKVEDHRIRVYPSQTAAWAAAADGAGVAPAPAHLVCAQVRRGELRILPTWATPAETTWYATTLMPERRSPAAEAFLHFLTGATALRVMREPGSGLPPSRFRPPVYVTLWS